jgi:hypothetical protein
VYKILFNLLYGREILYRDRELESILTRINSKYFDGKRRIRIERQKYPTKTVLDAIEKKLGANIG